MLHIYNTGYGRSDHITATQTAGARADPDFSGIRVCVCVCVSVPIPPTNCPTRNLSPATWYDIGI